MAQQIITKRPVPETKVKLGSSGRLVIPAAVREALLLKEGDDLILRVDAGELRLASQKSALARARQTIRKNGKGNVRDFIKWRQETE